MKVLKAMSMLVIASMISLGVYAQATPSSAPAKTTTTQSTTTKSSSASSQSTDKVNPALKGPKGETVYTGPKGGNYYMKDGKKVYMKK